ncbi:hypothetical protein [Alkalicoccus daliensis]|uniref:Uncharacterized protein n=1 Tax=Alkalicoccus daliensis TaxID=745820 RepID=A0A1H0GID4_9BACI|nr:hypothetical protein [Alkalicoccus daliensis]SDO06509.1 hypothetical protein SAMN04488053_106117 [Alkalicoccus daliensis]
MENFTKSVYEAVLKNKNIEEINEVAPYAYTTSEKNVLVYLSVANNFTRAVVTLGSSKTVPKAVNRALASYRKHNHSNLPPVSVKIDIVTNVFAKSAEGKRMNVKKDEIEHETGKEGIAFSKDFRISFLPEEVEAYDMIKNKLIKKENVFAAFEKHFLLFDQQSVKSFLTNEFMDVYSFHTEAHYYDDNGYTPLIRGHRMYDKLTRNLLLDSIQLAKDNYFKQAVNNKGKIVYAYQPQDGSQTTGYNILRHAGTVYSMLEVYEQMPDENLLKASKRAIKFLLSKIKNITINNKEALAVVEKDACKLGGNALAVIALCKYTELSGDKQYLPIMQKLALWMVESQDKTGKFAVHKQIFSTGKVTDFVSHYYPGEAILSLVRLSKVDGDSRWLDAAENEAKYLINRRDKNETKETVAHDHWLLYGLNELYRERANEIYVTHSFFIADAIAESQRTDRKEHDKEWIGSYKSKLIPASTPVACRSEGLGAAYQLAVYKDRNDLAEKYKSAVDLGIRFQLQMQLRPESVMYYVNKKLCLGAFQGGLHKYELRNDYTQHNISSIIAYSNILQS